MATPSRWSGRPLSRPGPNVRGSSVPATDRSRKKPRKSGSLSALSPSALTSRGQAADGLESSRWNRAALETGALVLALLLVAGIIVYFSWPYSQDELYRKAEALMASSKRSDWHEARDEYLDKLDQRFPNHPFREQIQKWRDKIALEDAERRAAVPERPRSRPIWPIAPNARSRSPMRWRSRHPVEAMIWQLWINGRSWRDSSKRTTPMIAVGIC